MRKRKSCQQLFAEVSRLRAVLKIGYSAGLSPNLHDAMVRGGRMSKYKSRTCEQNGIKFASEKEARRYSDLLLLERAGEIKEIELQPRFLIAAPVILDGRKCKARYYFADFSYEEKGERVYEDVKGMKLPMYKLKRHLVRALYGIEVREV